MKVSILSISFMIVNLIVGFLIPIVLAVYNKKKYKSSLLSFFTGCGVMLVFAFILEQIIHVIVLSSPIGLTIQNNFWFYAFYGGLMAGLFEETGRFFAMRFILSKKVTDPHNALMYGAGHGGFEALVILGVGMINNLIYSVCINTGTTDLLTASLDEATKQTFQAALDNLVNTSPFLFLAGPVERLAAVAAQIALSVLVWFAATHNGQMKWYFIAILLHFLLDAIAVIFGNIGVPIALIEAAIYIMALCIAFLAWKVWKKNVLEANE